MPLAIQVFIIVAGIFLVGLLISLIIRSIQLFINIILPLIIIGLLIWLAKDVFGLLTSIPRTTIGITLGSLLTIGIVFRLLKNITGTIASIFSRLLSLTLSFFILVWLFKSGIINNFIDWFNDIFTPDNPPVNTGNNNTGYNEPPPVPIIGMSCELPRGGTLPDNFYVYAYQNRNDSLSICNVEIRLCKDGILQGSHEQPYCYPLIDNQIKVIPFDPTNEKISKNPLIQPGPTPYKNAIFNTDGKRITKILPPIQVPDIPFTQNSESEQSYILKKYCIAPWGELIKPGQFTKAYLFPEGDKNEPCLPELRLCKNGKLLGNFLYPNCSVNNNY